MVSRMARDRVGGRDGMGGGGAHAREGDDVLIAHLRGQMELEIEPALRLMGFDGVHGVVEMGGRFG